MAYGWWCQPCSPAQLQGTICVSIWSQNTMEVKVLPRTLPAVLPQQSPARSTTCQGAEPKTPLNQEWWQSPAQNPAQSWNPTSGITLPRNTASDSADRGNCRADAPCNRGAQPATLPGQGAHWAAPLEHGVGWLTPHKGQPLVTPTPTSEHTQLETLAASLAHPWTLRADTSNNPS